MDKHASGSFYLYPDANMPTAAAVGTGFSPYCILSNGGAAFSGSRADTVSNSTCVASAASVLYSVDCHEGSPTDGFVPITANNTYYLDSGAYALTCGKSVWTLAEAQARGLDVGSTWSPTPGTAGLLALVTNFVTAELMP
jgi:hypothetical protein